jgi:2-polyprenyl-6-methoxyphenol hydroxylase-like FAD-dependent oxidoreductase
MFGRLLQQHNIACTIYDADEDRNSRNQGGTLDLHPKSGQRAIKEAGLWDEFVKYARPEGECEKLVKYDGTVMWDENVMTDFERPKDGGKPEIDRVRLRQILLDSLPPSMIKWNCKVARVEADPRQHANYTIHFADGSKESYFDLVVGADGAWSKVRPLVTDTKPYYAGVQMVDLWATKVSEKHQWLSDYVGKGSVFMFDDGRAIIAQRNGGDLIRVYACIRQPEDFKDSCGIDWSDKVGARQALVDGYFSDCSKDLQQVILEASDELTVRPLHMLPVGIRWETVPGVTLIGDAAHLMTPAGAVGVNTALTDAFLLARALVSKKDSFFAKALSDRQNIAAAIKEYEAQMFDNAKE